MNAHFKILAVVVTYNGNKWIHKCLTSLLNSSTSLQIIVIDNASTDNTVNLIKGNFPEIELLELKTNSGFGAANNIGFKKALEAKADYVFLLNQDAYINNNTVEILINTSLKNPDYGILSPIHYNYSGNAPEQYFEEWVMKKYTNGLENDFIKGNMFDLYPTSFVHAACWLMPISTIKQVGGFDPLFHHYGEDNDYIQRLFASKKLAGIVPAASVFHQGSNEGLKSPEKNVSFLINQSLLLFKNPNASTNGAVLLFMKQCIRNSLFSYSSPLSKALRFNLRRINKMIGARRKQNSAYAYLEL